MWHRQLLPLRELGTETRPRILDALNGGLSFQRLGDALLAAQKAYAETGLMPELLGVYHRFETRR